MARDKSIKRCPGFWGFGLLSHDRSALSALAIAFSLLTDLVDWIGLGCGRKNT
jgi:hypothetical protein